MNMIRMLSLLLLGTSSLTHAQLQVNTLNLTTNDLIYDAITNKIYASIPAAQGANGNSIGVINPDTYLLDTTVFMGSDPSVLAISDNGQYIYSGFNGSPIVRRFDVASQTAGLQFSLGSDPFEGPFYAEDIEVMPGQPTTVAISRKDDEITPRHQGIAIYDNEIMRPTTTPDHIGSNKIEFTSQNSLIGYNNESTEFGIRKLSINSAGVINVSVTQNVMTNFDIDFVYNDSYIYSSDGQVVDVAGTPYVVGQFSNTSGQVVYDSHFNRVCFASNEIFGNITFKRFKPSTFLLYDSLAISQATGYVKKIITCGNGCYAFNTSDKVIIIKDLALDLPESKEKSNISIYPNPTTDYLFIKSDFNIKEIQISDVNGRIITILDNPVDKLNLASLSAGIYVIKISDFNGKIITEKIIKK